MDIDLSEPSLIDSQGRSKVHWWIVFEKGHCRHWWTRLFDSEMRHCWAVRQDGKHFIAFQPYLGITTIDILQITDPRDIAPEATAVLSVQTWANTGRIRDLVPACFNCVEQVKALLGIRAWGVVTPRQLMNYCITQPHIAATFTTTGGSDGRYT
jgi:hypothetical protein